MSDVICVSYGPEEMDVVERGIDAIRDVLYHGSYEESASLLFCLERYLDPWFGYSELPEFQELNKQIFVLLQEVVLDKDLCIDKGEALNQLRYCREPLIIFEKVLDTDIGLLGERICKTIEDVVYLNKIFRAIDNNKAEEILRGYPDWLDQEAEDAVRDCSNLMEYYLDQMISVYAIDAVPEKLARWYKRWFAEECQPGLEDME